MSLPGPHDSSSYGSVCEHLLAVQEWVTIEMYVGIIARHWSRTAYTSVIYIMHRSNLPKTNRI